ncbi:YciI family protein [Pseudomonas sp. PNP]|uniref:YciI family protein n=1 Tax=Pseudomonas sp. PNP TaxID=361819 RepID=UPI001FEEECC7|nr:YciI family protein [Pseudomonas sp. PNP]
MALIKATAQSEANVMPSAKLMEDMDCYVEDLAKAGVLLAHDFLQPSSSGVRILGADRGHPVMDGPFSNVQELIAGFWLWQVHSMDEAVEWARRCPAAMTPGFEIEIRRVTEAHPLGDDYSPESREQEEQLRFQIAKQRHHGV